MKHSKKYLKQINEWFMSDSNRSFLSRHPELEKFDMPKTFYFRYLPERKTMHWAIIIPQSDSKRANVFVYFINDWGRVFDKLEFKHKTIAQRQLRKNGFEFSTNRYCPFTPPEPIYIKLSCGKKSAPYSKGNLWQSVQRSEKHINKLENTYIQQKVKYYECYKNWIFKGKTGVSPNIYNIKQQIEDNSTKSKMEQYFPYGFRRLINDVLKVFLIFYIILIIVLVLKGSI